MKTNKLIQLLQEADPSGERECCVDNTDILFIEPEEAYWDGRLQILLRDENNKVSGIKVTGEGMKVSIHTLSIEDAIFDNPDLPVIFELDSPSLMDYKDSVSRMRKEAKEIWESMDKERSKPISGDRVDSSNKV